MIREGLEMASSIGMRQPSSIDMARSPTDVRNLGELERKIGGIYENNCHLKDVTRRVANLIERIAGATPQRVGEDEESARPEGLLERIRAEIEDYGDTISRIEGMVTHLEQLI